MTVSSIWVSSVIVMVDGADGDGLGSWPDYILFNRGNDGVIANAAPARLRTLRPFTMKTKVAMS